MSAHEPKEQYTNKGQQKCAEVGNSDALKARGQPHGFLVCEGLDARLQPWHEDGFSTPENSLVKRLLREDLRG